MDDIRPGYYAIIPADVRYDDSIPPNAKLLYGEISALIGKDGYCYASNKYFSDVYGFAPETIARLVSRLEEAGYIRREEAEVRRQERLEEMTLSPELDYKAIRGLRIEAAEKLQKLRPLTVGQASRISGVNPADISVLLIYLKHG